MDQMTARDSRNLLRAVQILNVSLDLSTLAQRTIAAVNHVVPADVVTYNEVDPVPRRISDFLTDKQFRSLALHSEFFRVFDINYQMAMVVQHAGQQMIGVAVNRVLSDFTERERTCLAVLRSHVVQAYGHGLTIERLRTESRCARDARAAACATAGGLTQREGEVLHWVAGGKSNDDVARIIGVTSATVKKHLEHIYDKLGVANRTAA